MGYGMGAGYGWIFMLVFWVLLITVVVWVVTWLVPGSARGAGDRQQDVHETPLEILDRRLASGEIDIEEYVRVREQLTTDGVRRGG